MELLAHDADIYGWTSVISSNSCFGMWEKALQMLSCAHGRSMQPTLVTFNALVGTSADADSHFVFPWMVSLKFLDRCQADVTRRVL